MPITLPHPPPSSLLPYTTLFRSSDSLSHSSMSSRTAILIAADETVSSAVKPRRQIIARPPGYDPVAAALARREAYRRRADRKSTRLNSSHLGISYAVFCLKKKNN